MKQLVICFAILFGVTVAGAAAFAGAFDVRRTLLVGGDGIPVEEFLNRPVSRWLAN